LSEKLANHLLISIEQQRS